jgi:hypothetical protein
MDIYNNDTQIINRNHNRSLDNKLIGDFMVMTQMNIYNS